MQTSFQSESNLAKAGKFAVKTLLALFCAIQSAILLDEKAWPAFGISILLFLPLFLSRKNYPQLTLPFRMGLLAVGEIVMIVARTWNGGL